MRYRFMRFPEWKSRAVTMSFDDGSYDDIKLVEMFNRYGLKGSFNISSQGFSNKGDPTPRKITEAEAKAIYYPGGHEVAVHGLRHISPYLSATPVMIREMLEDRIGLEKMFGRLIFGSALPDDGRITPQMTETLRSLGFHYCRCLSYDSSFCLPQDWMNMMPTSKHNAPDLFEKIDKFLEFIPQEKYISQRESRWFCIWGHSHELRGQNNWELIDRIGEKLGGHSDIWYANVGDICEYTRAYQSLEFAADDSIVYNPTQYTIFMEIDKKNIKIEPGETLYSL